MDTLAWHRKRVKRSAQDAPGWKLVLSGRTLFGEFSRDKPPTTLDLFDGLEPQPDSEIAALWRELHSPARTPRAYRRGRRYCESLEPGSRPPDEGTVQLDGAGTYVVTGGLGGRGRPATG